MASSQELRTEPVPLYRVLRECYRNYLTFRDLVSSTGESVFAHGYFIYDDDGKIKDRMTLSVSFWDLHNALCKLSARKREAVFYNVILDWKQKDVAERMQITTVSVGQYVMAAMEQLATDYFDLNETEMHSKKAVKLNHGRTTTRI